MEGRKAEKLFSLIYGLSLTIMKDIQGVFWGCPRIEALFWPGLGGYVTALTGRALEWHSRGQRFDPAYLHHKKRHPIGCLFFILKVAGFWQVRRILFCIFFLHSPVYGTDNLIV